MSNDAPQKTASTSEWTDPSKELDDFDRAILRQKLANPNMKIIQLARLFKADRGNISRRIKKRAFLYAMRESQERANTTVKRKLALLADKSLDTLDRLQDAKSEHVQQQAAKSGLEFAIGSKRIIEGGDKSLRLNLTDEDRAVAQLLLAEKKAKESKQQN